MKKTKKPKPVQGEWSDQKEYEFHPLSERFPLMEGEEFEDMADDIVANGQKETVKLYRRKIIDGRNRYRACKARGVPCRFENWNGKGDPADFVLSMNLHRRHLTPEGRKALVVQLRKNGKSIRQIAESLRTSVGSVHRDIEKATVPNGTVGGQDLPTTIKGKDGKVRQARKPNGKNQPKPNGKVKPSDEDNTAKGDRPKSADLIEIIHRGLGATDEVKELSLKPTAVFFRVNGYRVKVTCKIVGAP